MACSDFTTLTAVKKKFDLTIDETQEMRNGGGLSEMNESPRCALNGLNLSAPFIQYPGNQANQYSNRKTEKTIEERRLQPMLMTSRISAEDNT